MVDLTPTGPDGANVQYICNMSRNVCLEVLCGENDSPPEALWGVTLGACTLPYGGLRNADGWTEDHFRSELVQKI